ncbi:MAG TPA: hypothetical protein GXZ48_05145 [Acholeplasmataceae bacterium]|nr:hypothetical protein [Acholeplasmataceae bacterium]
MVIDAILEAREKRIEKIKSIDGGVISVKANIPGENKSINIAFILIKIFVFEVLKNINVINKYFYESADGPYFLLVTNRDEKVKDILINLEENHPLGRYIDLDLYIDKTRSISRGYMRKCILCDKDAFYCIRNKTHKNSEVLSKIKIDVLNYLKQIIYDLSKKAIYSELNLEYKFGLVTPSSSGSHRDMDYKLMEKAIGVILPGFENMFLIGFHGQDLNRVYKDGKKYGLFVEKEMFSVTSGINCYKGLIFILGLVVLSIGYTLANNLKYEDIFKNIKVMTKDIFSETKYNTFGEYAYEKYKFGGARAEAQSGLKSVQIAIKYLENYKEINDEALHMTLIEIIKNIDDTVMLKRAKELDKYHYYKNLVSQITSYDIKIIKAVTGKFINNNISCGGAADILIAALFIHQLKKIFW